MWIKPETQGVTSNNSEALKGIKIGIVGSSSAMPRIYGQSGFFTIIEERTGYIPVNYAISGSTTTSLLDDYTQESSNHIRRLEELPLELDMVIAQLGANDDNKSKPLGSFDSRTPTEFYGALHIFCEKLLTKYPEKPVGVMTSQYSGNQSSRTSAYHEAIKEVCGWYGIPVVDLKKEGQTPYHLPYFKNNFCEDDLHLNGKGSAILSRRVESFLLNLLGK